MEAILRSTGGLCNLSETVVRPEDDIVSLRHKVRLATILGTLQSSLTNFRYLRKVWKDNAEEERLLGVSLTGIMDHPVLSGRTLPYEDYDKWGGCRDLIDVLVDLKGVARRTNEEWAEKLGIAKSKQLTLVKPSGTVSQLVDCSSGMHPRYSNYYIRKVTQDNKDPLTQLMIDQGVPHQLRGDKTYFAFPMSSPCGAIIQQDMDAISQLELWKIYQRYWCDGNPSQTIYYTDDTFPDVQSWVWKNWDRIGGLSFFPVDNNIYDIMPYNPISEEEYNKLSSEFPVIDWTKLKDYESTDHTTSSQELNCSGGACEL